MLMWRKATNENKPGAALVDGDHFFQLISTCLLASKVDAEEGTSMKISIKQNSRYLTASARFNEKKKQNARYLFPCINGGFSPERLSLTVTMFQLITIHALKSVLAYRTCINEVLNSVLLQYLAASFLSQIWKKICEKPYATMGLQILAEQQLVSGTDEQLLTSTDSRETPYESRIPFIIFHKTQKRSMPVACCVLPWPYELFFSSKWT